MAEPALDNIFQADERAAADEENSGRIDADIFLLRMLAPALRGNIADGALKDFEQSLLDAFARNVARERHIFGLASDLVDFVDVNDSALSFLYVVIGILEQAQNDVFDIFADITRFGESGGVSDGEWDIEDSSEAASEQCFAGTGIADEQDVALFDFDFVVARGRPFLLPASGRFSDDPLVMIVDGNGKGLFGMILTDTMHVQMTLDIGRLGNVLDWSRLGFAGLWQQLLVEDVLAKNDA